MNLHRRKYRIITLIAVTGGIYICFQLVSLKVLNLSGQRESRVRALHAGKVLDDFEPHVDLENQKQLDKSDSMVQSDKAVIQDLKRDLSRRVVGILASMSENYQPLDGMFRCIESQVSGVLLFNVDEWFNIILLSSSGMQGTTQNVRLL